MRIGMPGGRLSRTKQNNDPQGETTSRRCKCASKFVSSFLLLLLLPIFFYAVALESEQKKELVGRSSSSSFGSFLSEKAKWIESIGFIGFHEFGKIGLLLYWV